MKRHLRPIVAIAWLLLLSLTPRCRGKTSQSQAVQVTRPNIVFVLVDDLRWDALGSTGHPFVKTPNIDRLAKEGLMFRNAFVTTPLCSPSRSSFLTGQYAHKTGVLDNTNHNELSHSLQTWPRLLQQAGYATGYVGKWHMGNDDSPRPGFDRWVSFRGQGVYGDPPLNVDGKSQQHTGYITDLLSDYAVEFVKREHQKPFALYLAHKAVHEPYTPAARHKELFSDQPIKRAPSAQDPLDGKPVLQRAIEGQVKLGPGTGPADQLVRNQLRCLTSIDEGVGRILKALEETEQLDNTIVIFTSDNGFFWGEHGVGDKRAAYEESIRIPLLIRYPKLIKAGTQREQMVLNIDIAPTLLELAGVKIPADVQGRSLVQLFGTQGNSAKGRTAFLAEYFAERHDARIPTWQTVRTPGWKFIHYNELEGMDELYDLQTDRYEMKNLISDAKHQAQLKELQAQLAQLLAETK